MPRSSSRVHYLRLALILIMERRGLTQKTLAQDIGVEFNSVKNLLSQRNKSENVHRIEEYLRNMNALDPDVIFILGKLFPENHKKSHLDIHSLYPLAIRTFLEIDESHAIPNFDQYAGSYLGYRYAFDEDQIAVIWIQLFGPSNEIDIPTYKAFQRSVGGAEFSGKGFVVSSRLNIALVGSKSPANIELARLHRVDHEVIYLHGIVLTENSRGAPLSARIYCDRISKDPNFDRSRYDNIITNMDSSSFINSLKKIGKTKDEISRILFYIDNSIPNNTRKNVLASSIDTSWRDYAKYQVD